ncbi:18922_t:CDS:2, partial [Gigaspora margarita]
TTELTPSQPIQSTSSKTIIDIDSTSTPFESDSLNTETSQTIHNISISTIEFEQEQTTTFYSVLPSPIQILDSRSAPVSPIISPTLFNISSTPPNISLLTSTADYWSSVAVNCNIEQSSSSSYTPLYPQLDTSNNFSSKFSPIPISTQYSAPLTYTAILNQVRTLNNHTDNQDLFSNHPTSDEESNSSDSETEMNDATNALTQLAQALKNNQDRSSNSFTVTTEVLNQSIKD